MITILVISDTHGKDLQKIEDIIHANKYDVTIHCGDHSYPLDKMKELFTYFVPGNNDINASQEIIKFKLDQYNFILMHGHQFVSHPHSHWIKRLFNYANKNDADVILFGHSHSYEVKINKDYKILCNPGSATQPRIGKPTYMVITINNHEIDFKKKELS